MRTIEELVAAAQKATAESLHEAFQAGRARAASDLKLKMASFFEGLIAEAGSQPASGPPAPSNGEHQPEHHPDGHHD
jgi:hypothetical protein